MSETTVVAARGLAKTYAADGVPVRAVDEVDLAVEAGETVSVMGPPSPPLTAVSRPAPGSALDG
jgi:ABC-type glutathione transport system ATPase component